MKTKRFFSLGLPAVLLALVLGGCSTGGGDPPFIAVTGISGVQFATAVDYGLRLSGTVEPANATNQTITWSGNGVSNGVLTADSAGSQTVTATIANGKESGSYTQNFTITAYQADPVGPSENPFGDDTSPYIWAVDDNMGGIGYVTVKNTTWVATDGGSTYNSGTYTPASIAVVPWIVGTGYNTGDTGLAFISSGKMHVVNLSSVFSDMNGTLTKLDTNKTLDGGGTGTWTTSGPSIYYYNDWVKIVASSGSFTESVAPDGSAWREIVKGTYPNTTNTNPAICTITQVDIGFLTNGAPDWKNWSDLDPVQKQSFGGSETFPVIIYNDRCETYGITLQP